MAGLSEQTNPWYREPWPWILMAGPAVVVVAGLTTAWFATVTQDPLVEGDYYKSGLAINQTLERDEKARSLHLKGQLMVGEDLSQIRLMLDGGDLRQLPPTLKLKVLHPTRGGLDQEISLTQNGVGLYEGHLKGLGATNKWQLILEDTDKHWRLSGTWHVTKDRVVTLQSKG